MRKLKVAAISMVIASVCVLSGCNATWSVSVKKKVGQPTEVDGTISGKFPAAIRAMSERMTVMAPTTLYIDTSGTDFNLDNYGQVVITLADASGSAIAAQAFPWVKVGAKLEFQNPTAVQNWINQYPSAADVSYNLNPGGSPVDGSDHVMHVAVVYNGNMQASASATFAAQCYTRYHTVSLCHGNL